MGASSFAAEKGYVPDEQDALVLAGLCVEDVESAYSSSRLFSNIVADKKRRSSGLTSGSRGGKP